MRVLLLSRYGQTGASSRYRAYQYLPYLRDHGFDVTVSQLLDDEYLANRYAGRRQMVMRTLRAYRQRIAALLGSHHYDLIWVQKEVLPWTPGWLRTLIMGSRTPVVADYDDAVFHRYDLHPSRMMRLLLGHSVDWEMRRAALVIAGNQYLAQRAQVAGARRIEILPTVIDLKRYAAAVPRPLQERIFTVGWIGTPHTAGDLETLRPVLREFCRDGQARFLAIGAGPLDWPDVPVVVVPWSEESEVEDLQMADVGIMPVPDSPWERGKCGLKLLQYMASCRPVIASPVGVNRELVSDGVNGFLATTSSEWLVALRTLQEDSNLRCRMGLAGRSLIEGNYSLEVAAPKLARLMANLLQETRS